VASWGSPWAHTQKNILCPSGLSWAALEPSRALLGLSWFHLGPSWGFLGPSWDRLGLSWGHLCPSWGFLGVVSGDLRPSVGRLDFSLETSQGCSEPSSAISGRLGGPHGQTQKYFLFCMCPSELSWAALEPSQALLGVSRSHLGLSWGCLCPSWGCLGLSWGHLGPFLGCLGAVLGDLRPSRVVLGRLEAAQSYLRPSQAFLAGPHGHCHGQILVYEP